MTDEELAELGRLTALLPGSEFVASNPERHDLQKTRALSCNWVRLAAGELPLPGNVPRHLGEYSLLGRGRHWATSPCRRTGITAKGAQCRRKSCVEYESEMGTSRSRVVDDVDGIVRWAPHLERRFVYGLPFAFRRERRRWPFKPRDSCSNASFLDTTT